MPVSKYSGGKFLGMQLCSAPAQDYANIWVGEAEGNIDVS